MTIGKEVRGLAAVIEPIAFNAWPAPDVQSLGGWRMRFADGFSGRGNSVAAFGDPGLEIGEAVSRAVAAYRGRGLKPLFQTTPADEPEGLDNYLSTRGWTALKPVHVMVAAAKPVGPGDVSRVVLAPRMSAAWQQVFDAGVADPRDAAERRGMIARIGAGAVFALALADDGIPAAVGLGVAERGYGGIFCMRTIATARRRGYARLLLNALSDALHNKGAHTLYLQVEQGNEGAIALYRDAGFNTAYDYRYRASPEDREKRAL